jgi:hypothetical protein
VLFTKNNYNKQVKKDEMGLACGTTGREEEKRNAYEVLV